MQLEHNIFIFSSLSLQSRIGPMKRSMRRQSSSCRPSSIRISLQCRSWCIGRSHRSQCWCLVSRCWCSYLSPGSVLSVCSPTCSWPCSVSPSPSESTSPSCTLYRSQTKDTLLSMYAFVVFYKSPFTSLICWCL